MAFRLVGQQSSLALDRQSKAPLGKVVRSPLHQNRGELIRNQGPKKREILLHQLLLQTDGVRADDDLVASIPEHAGDRGKEIGEALPRSGTRFNEEALTISKRVLDRGRHLQLLWSRFETLESSSDRAVGSEHGTGGKNHEKQPGIVSPRYQQCRLRQTVRGRSARRSFQRPTLRFPHLPGIEPRNGAILLDHDDPSG